MRTPLEKKAVNVGNRWGQRHQRVCIYAVELTTIDAVDFGKELRRRRDAVGLTLEALAERAGLTPNYIGGIETGKRDPSLTTVLALAKGLRIPAAELLGSVRGISPAAIEAGRLYESSLPDIQDAVIQLFRAVLGRR